MDLEQPMRNMMTGQGFYRAAPEHRGGFLAARNGAKPGARQSWVYAENNHRNNPTLWFSHNAGLTAREKVSKEEALRLSSLTGEMVK
jgi:hypothetical protein